MDEDPEMPSGSDLFRITVWDTNGRIVGDAHENLGSIGPIPTEKQTKGVWSPMNDGYCSVGVLSTAIKVESQAFRIAEDKRCRQPTCRNMRWDPRLMLSSVLVPGDD